MSESVFLYHAHGFALGGTITQPYNEQIDSHAATTLPIVGGYASAKAEAYRFKDLVSYRSAQTYISGIKNDDGAHSTSVTTIVEELNILDVITADKIIGRLSSSHKKGEQPEIIALGSEFVNLKIAGQPVQVDLDHDLFVRHPTYSALLSHLENQKTDNATRENIESKPKVRYQWGHSNHEIPNSLLKRGMLVPPDSGWVHSNQTLHSSLVKQVLPVKSDSSPEEVPYGYAIRIPNVGCLYLAEVFTSAETKRLTMLRVELGSPVTGRIAAAGPVSNGSWYP